MSSLPVYSSVLSTGRTFTTCSLRATPGNPKAQAANDPLIPPAAAGVCGGHCGSRPSALNACHGMWKTP